MRQPTHALGSPLVALSGLLISMSLPAQEGMSMEIFYGNRPTEYKVAQWGPEQLPSPLYAFKAAKIMPGDSEPIVNGVIITQDSKIIAIGRSDEVEIPEGCEVFDMGDSWILPGFIDLHCHMIGRGGFNDSFHQTNPEMRTLDVINLNLPIVKRAVAGGVTSVLFIPGSGSNMGGFGTLSKTAGDPEDALIRFPGSMKIAQAGNPERRTGELGAGRMGMNQGLRMTLQDGYDYYKAWEDFDAGVGPKPDYRADLHLLRGLFRYEYPISVHTQQYQVVLETLRELRVEFDLWTFIDHGTFDGYRLSGEAKRVGVPVCNGPRQYLFDRAENKFIGLTNAWYAGGLHGWREPVEGLGRDGIAINTDSVGSSGVTQEQLPMQVAMSIRLGLPYDVGIRAITINPARFIGIDHRVGSLEVGKDADIGIWSDDPIDPRSHVRMTVINGRIEYRRDPKRPLF